MPFSHHSHSGQFCAHAKDTLEEVVQIAIKRKLHTIGVTEHMPRENSYDLYPEEDETPETLSRLFDRYYIEACRLRTKYASEIQILIGFETEWIRETSLQTIKDVQAKYDFDLFVGSVHHLYTIPIDYDDALYQKAMHRSGGDTEEQLFLDYFDAQHAMLKALKPPIVGHFDLIRLKSRDPEASFRRWETVWQRISRNLEFIVSYGGLVELNSASLRKGMSEPYPNAEICRALLQLGGRFTLSDDSHGVDQVALNYHGVLDHIDKVNTNSRVATERAEALNRTPATKTGIHAATTLGTVISDGPAAHVEPATGNKAFVVALKALVEQFHGSNATLATDLLFLISPEGLSMLSELTAFYQAKLSAMISDSHRDSLGSTTNQTSEPVVPAPSAPRALPPRPRASSGPGLLQPPPRRSGHQVIPYGYQASLRRTGRFEFAPGEKRVFVGTNGRVKK
ncbi:MAG: histidinolphosphatase [Caeruleum heppii]|nr:MAG: histidinolphosphatase [Caeruleum heppii]